MVPMAAHPIGMPAPVAAVAVAIEAAQEEQHPTAMAGVVAAVAAAAAWELPSTSAQEPHPEMQMILIEEMQELVAMEVEIPVRQDC